MNTKEGIIMFVAIYVRVSTGLQVKEGTSLNSQVEICFKKALELGFHKEQIKVYREEGESGEDLERPLLDQLRGDVASGVISHVIITDPDRFSRDMTNKLLICRELQKRDVELIFTDSDYKNTPEGELFFNMKSAIAQYELAMIKKRTVRGRNQAVKKLNKVMPMRTPPFGYDWVDCSLVVNEKEAEFVRLIYNWYVFEGLTLREMGTKLYELGAVPKRSESGNFSASSLRRILTSEIYIGRYVYNRRETKKLQGERTKSGKPRKTYSIRNEEDWIEASVPKIIDPAIFELAQQQKEKNKKRAGNVKHDYLLRGMIRCSRCGRVWESTSYSGRVDKSTGKKSTYACYRCPNKNPKRYGDGIHKCDVKTIRTDILDEYIWGLIVQTLKSPNLVIEQLQNTSDEATNEIKQILALTETQISKKEAERERVKTMFKRGVIDESEMVGDLTKINTEIETLDKRKREYRTQIDSHLKKELSSRYIEGAIEAYRNTLMNNFELSFDEKRNIVEKLIQEVIIDYVDDEVKVTCVGVLDVLMNKEHENDIALELHREEI